MPRPAPRLEDVLARLRSLEARVARLERGGRRAARGARALKGDGRARSVSTPTAVRCPGCGLPLRRRRGRCAECGRPARC